MDAPAIDDSPQRLHRTAMLVLGGVVLFRLLYLVPFLAQFGLASDESYYWDWGRRLDWGYFSKPPMIGWIMGLVGRLSGNSEWGIRLAALFIGTVSLWLLHRFTSRCFGPRAALTALLLAAVTPANIALNLFLTIDAPLVLHWTAALCVFWRLVQEPDKRGRWVLLTLILGLGHLSKQMMLVFPLLMILFCAFTPEAKPLLRRPAFWICALGSLLFLTPVIWWNANHDWVTLRHTSHHFETNPNASPVDHLATFGTFIGLQALVFTPLTWVVMVAAVVGGLWKWKLLKKNERFAVVFSAPALVVFTLLSLRQNINPNWPAVYYISAVSLAAAWLERAALAALPWEKLRRCRRPALVVALVISAGSCVLPLLAKPLGFEGSDALDPAQRLRGWREVGLQAQAMLDRTPRPGETFILTLGNRELTSQLAFYMPQQPHVFHFSYSDIVESQYELWPDPGDAGYMDGDALLFVAPDDQVPPGFTVPHALDRQFQSERSLGEIRVPLGKGGPRIYKVLLEEHLKFWEPPPSPEARNAAKVREQAASSG